VIRRFLPLCSDFLTEVWKALPRQEAMLVLPTASAAREAGRRLQQDWQGEYVPALSLVELKERLLPPSAPLLPPFLRPLVLDGLLDAPLRGRFHIYGATSLRRFADRFFWFFEHLREDLVSLDVDTLDAGDWQRESALALLEVRRRYAARLDELRRTDLCLLPVLPCFESLGCRRVAVLNPVAATPLERELLRRLGEHCEVHLFYQMPPEWLTDAGELNVDPLAAPPDALLRRLTVSRHVRPDDQLTGLMARLDAKLTNVHNRWDERTDERTDVHTDERTNDRPAVLVAEDLAAQPLGNLLSPRVFRLPQARPFLHSALYRYLTDLRLLAAAREVVDGQPLLGAAEVETALAGPVGALWLGETAPQLHRRVMDLRERCYYFHADLRELDGAAPLAGAVRLLDGPGATLLEALWALPRSLEPDARMWEVFFETLASFESATRSAGLALPVAVDMLDTLLPMLASAAVTTRPDPTAPCDAQRLQDGLASSCDDLCLLYDVVDGRLPVSAVERYLFTERQARGLGMPGVEQRQQVQRYAFWRRLCRSREAVLFTRDCPDENVAPSGLIEEALTWARAYGVQVLDETPPLLAVNRNLYRGGEPWPGRAPDMLRLPYEPSRDLAPLPLSVTPSQIVGTAGNPAAFFLAVCAGLRERAPVERLDALAVGNLVHSLMERFFNNLDERRSAGAPLPLDEPALRAGLQRAADTLFPSPRWTTAVPGGFERTFFTRVLLPFVIEGAVALIGRLATEWLREGVPRFLTECPAEVIVSGEVPLRLHGRADLVVNAGTRRWVLDFKTGRTAEPLQLRLYELLFREDGSTPHSRFVLLLHRALCAPDDKTPLAEDALRALLEAPGESGLWALPRRAEAFDPYAALYRTNLAEPDEEEEA